MSTTTIRLPEELKTRVSLVSDRIGKTAHSFILEAIAEKTEQEEQRSRFHDLADARYAEIVATGQTIPWSEMRTYLEKRITGENAARPAARKLGD
jgi:predicted DNA-binding protein